MTTIQEEPRIGLIETVLWDFGDTLADQRWILRAPEGAPEWPEVWLEVVAESGELATRWNRGEVTEAAVVDELAVHLPMTRSAIRDHIRARCRDVTFNEVAWASARANARRGNQALVTVNPDTFSEVVVAHYGLGELFGAVVVSWQEGTDDKVELSRMALDRLDCPGLDRALLIDNVEANVSAFERAGGHGYHFVGDRAFLSDLEAGRLPDTLRPDST